MLQAFLLSVGYRQPCALSMTEELEVQFRIPHDFPLDNTAVCPEIVELHKRRATSQSAHLPHGAPPS